LQRFLFERNRFELNRLRSGFSLVKHDLVGKPVPTFPDHASSGMPCSAAGLPTCSLTQRIMPTPKFGGNGAANSAGRAQEVR
jgi:hypothetical protein